MVNFSNANSINLKKGSILNLTKEKPALKRAILAAGWNPIENGQSADLDIFAVLLDRNGKVNTSNVEKHIIYFNNMRAKGIYLEGDNRTGDGDGDDERIFINLDEIDPNINQIIFGISIFEAREKGQTFSLMESSYVRLVDEDNDSEVCRYSLKDEYSLDTSIRVCALKRSGNEWHFEAIGEGCVKDIAQIFEMYV